MLPQVGAQRQSAAAKAPVPEPESTPQDPQPSLPTARQLARVLTLKAEALLVASKAMQSQSDLEARFAVPGKDASAVKQYLAGAGLLVRPASLYAVGLLPYMDVGTYSRWMHWCRLTANAAKALAWSGTLHKMSCQGLQLHVRASLTYQATHSHYIA